MLSDAGYLEGLFRAIVWLAEQLKDSLNSTV